MFPSNGLIMRTDDGLVLVDTAWNDAQTEEITAPARGFVPTRETLVLKEGEAARVVGQ